MKFPEKHEGSIETKPPHLKNLFSNIIGQSPELLEVLELIRIVGPSESSILIQGESGTGKELIAKAIHDSSPRKSGPFIAVNCGAIPKDLLESELFGHSKGSFTGATSQRIGRFELAHGGTLFLDEIGDLDFSLQVKILRALQEKIFEPVGSNRSVKINVRVISATNINLEDAVNEGRFREDLFYRLNVVPINIPPLRQRQEDIPILLEYFIKKHASTHLSRKGLHGISVEAQNHLCQYFWPGNIRELQNLVERISVLKTEGLIELKDLPLKYRSSNISENTGNNSGNKIPLSEIPDQGLDFNSAVDAYENALILKALEKTGWNRNQAAALLRLNRTTLVEKIKKKGLTPPEKI